MEHRRSRECSRKIQRQGPSEEDTTMMACMLFCVCFIVIIVMFIFVGLVGRILCHQHPRWCPGLMRHNKAPHEDAVSPLLSQRNNSFLWAFIKGFGGGLATLGPLVFLCCVGSNSQYGNGLRNVVLNLPRRLRFFVVGCVLIWVTSCSSVFAFGWDWPNVFLTPAPPQGPVFVRTALRPPFEVLQSDGEAYVPEPVVRTTHHVHGAPQPVPNYHTQPNYPAQAQPSYPEQPKYPSQPVGHAFHINPAGLVHSKLLDPEPPPALLYPDVNG